MRLPKHLAACLGVMLFVSCGDPVGMCACPPSTFRAKIEGRVTNAAGQPVPNARVLVQVGEPGCTGQVFGAAETRTTPAGEYETQIVDFREARPGDCLRAIAEPPAGIALAADTVPFAVRFGLNQVVDSARVDFVLPAP